MKLRIYSISLLLSFLVVLSHEMIPHHHHDNALDNFSNFHTYINKHSHNVDHDHHHHKSHLHNEKSESSDSRKHSFPPHNHTIASDDYNLSRLTIDSGTSLKVISFVVLYTSNTVSITNPTPNVTERRYLDKPFLIKSLFRPGAIGLRAPPSIA